MKYGDDEGDDLGDEYDDFSDRIRTVQQLDLAKLHLEPRSQRWQR